MTASSHMNACENALRDKIPFNCAKEREPTVLAASQENFRSLSRSKGAYVECLTTCQLDRCEMLYERNSFSHYLPAEQEVFLR
jgi:hypothetical protein